MPMSVSPDKRFLYAAVRSKPFTVVTYSIDSKSGALKQLATAPLAESFPYISIDHTGRYLLWSVPSRGSGRLLTGSAGANKRRSLTTSSNTLFPRPEGRYVPGTVIPSRLPLAFIGVSLRFSRSIRRPALPFPTSGRPVLIEAKD